MRLSVGLTFIIVSLSSCNSIRESNYDNLSLAKEHFAAFNHHDWPAMASLYKDSAMFLDPSFGKEYVMQSRLQIIEKYSAFQQLFPDIKDDVTGMYASGDKVIIEFTSSGTSRDTSFKLPIVTILTVDHGRIMRDATYYDVENP